MTLHFLNQDLEHKVITLLKNELIRFKKLLSEDYPASSEGQVEEEDVHHSVREGTLKITLHMLESMHYTDLANTLHNSKDIGSDPWLQVSCCNFTGSVFI